VFAQLPSDDVNTYAGLHARFYDVVYADKPYLHEARFVDSLISEAGVARGRLLDVACGTGRHASEFASLGWDVTGVDLSEELLEHARVNAPDARFFQQDMRELDLHGETFDAVTCLFDAIGYAVDQGGVHATLSGFGRHLSPGGVVVIEFLYGPALVRSAAPLRIRRFSLSGAGDELIRISQTRLDETRSLLEVEFELLELRADGGYERWRESQTNRYFALDEMQALLDGGGLNSRRFLPAYSDGTIDENTFHILAVATIR
jgi:SAM-dependent methyltransferase